MERRIPRAARTPEYEDSGLFKSPERRVLARLRPMVKYTNRQDVVIKALTTGDTEFIVTFAGRRALLSKPLIAKLSQAAFQARQDPTGTYSCEDPGPVLDVWVQGAWRKKVRRDEEGWEHMLYELVAAQWAIDTGQQPARLEGIPSLVSSKTVKSSVPLVFEGPHPTT